MPGTCAQAIREGVPISQGQLSPSLPTRAGYLYETSVEPLSAARRAVKVIHSMSVIGHSPKAW